MIKANSDMILEHIHRALVQTPQGSGIDSESRSESAAFDEARAILERLPLSPELIHEIDAAMLDCYGAGDVNGFSKGVRFAMSLMQEYAGMYSDYVVELGLSLDERAALLRYMRRCAEYCGMPTEFNAPVQIGGE